MLFDIFHLQKNDWTKILMKEKDQCKYYLLKPKTAVLWGAASMIDSQHLTLLCSSPLAFF